MLPLARALCLGTWRLRSRAGTYLLPELLQLDPHAVTPLVAAMRGLVAAPDASGEVARASAEAAAAVATVEETEEDRLAWTVDARLLWALVQVARASRRLGHRDHDVFAYDAGSALAGHGVVDHDTAKVMRWGAAAREAGCVEAGASTSTVVAPPAPLLTSPELQAAVTHAHPKVRLAAVELLCYSKTTTAMPTGKEFVAVCEALPAVFKVVSPHYQQELSQTLSRLIVRVRAALCRRLWPLLPCSSPPSQRARATCHRHMSRASTCTRSM